MVKKGVNDAEIGAIIDHAFDWRCVRGVTFQPVHDTGRNENFDPRRDRITLAYIRRCIVEDSGVFGADDMIPLPCNPSSITIGYGLRKGRQVTPVTSIISHEDLLSDIPNAVSLEKYPQLKQRIFDLFSLSTGPDSAIERLSALLGCLPSAPTPEGLSYENIFRVTVVEFLDAHNFCIGNVKRSCVHFVTPNGQIIPFDTYNLFYRNGRIDGIRRAMDVEQPALNTGADA